MKDNKKITEKIMALTGAEYLSVPVKTVLLEKGKVADRLYSMKTLGTKGLKALKIYHLLFAIMWIGGVMALLVSVQLGATPTTREMMYMAAECHLVIDEFFLFPEE